MLAFSQTTLLPPEVLVQELDVIHLSDIAESPNIRFTPGFRLYLMEAARFCLCHNGHLDGVLLAVEGSYTVNFTVHWPTSTEPDEPTFADHDEAAEHGAYGLAFSLVLKLTPHNVIERSVKGGGFDFWLGEPGDLLFQRRARLEVSGILSNPSQISSRTSRKVRQTKRSDHTDHGKLPTYVVVVEFSRPTSRIVAR